MQEIVQDKLQVSTTQAIEASENGEMLVMPTPQELLTSVLGERSGYIRGRGNGPKPPPKSAITAATYASFQAQLKAKDDKLLQMEQNIENMKDQLTVEIRDKLKEELTLDMNTRVNELVKKNMLDLMLQFNGNSRDNHDL